MTPIQVTSVLKKLIQLSNFLGINSIKFKKEENRFETNRKWHIHRLILNSLFVICAISAKIWFYQLTLSHINKFIELSAVAYLVIQFLVTAIILFCGNKYETLLVDTLNELNEIETHLGPLNYTSRAFVALIILTAIFICEITFASYFILSRVWLDSNIIEYICMYLDFNCYVILNSTTEFSIITFYYIVMKYLHKISYKFYEDPLKNVKFLINTHQKLKRLLINVNKIYSIQILIICTNYFVSIIIHTFAIYLLIISNYAIELVNMFLAIESITKLLIIIITSAKTMSQINAIKTVIIDQILETKDTKITRELNAYALQSLHEKVELTAGAGLFVLDYTLIHSIISTVVGYLIILIQFAAAEKQFNEKVGFFNE